MGLLQRQTKQGVAHQGGRELQCPFAPDKWVASAHQRRRQLVQNELPHVRHHTSARVPCVSAPLGILLSTVT